MTDDFVTPSTPTDPLPNDRLLEKYLAGEGTLSERIAFERWISANPEWRDALVTMATDGQVGRQAWRHPWHNPADARNMEQRVLATISRSADGMAAREHHSQTDRALVDTALSRDSRDQEMVSAGRYHPLQQKRAWIARLTRGNSGLYRTAIGVCGFLVIAIAAFLARHGSYTSTIAGVDMGPVSAYTTGNGQRSTITLPDGTEVILNVASRLEVPTDYHLGNRTLHLEGEALFSVIPHEKAPLIVNAGGTSTRVLGTRFVVRHYQSDRATTVTVQEGKVSVQGSVVTAAQRVVVDSLGVSPIIAADPAQFSFADGMLTLKYVPLASAISDLNRWYDAEIRLGDSALGMQELTGDFKAGSLTDLVAILELALPVHVDRAGRILTLYPRR